MMELVFAVLVIMELQSIIKYYTDDLLFFLVYNRVYCILISFVKK